MIFTGGVSIGQKEIEYVNDALINGWDLHHNDYIKKFEEAFAKYVGVKYARTLSGGTQALTLACATLGIGPGDEVIMPELTYFACSDVVKLLGATPVFVDIDKYSWCIDSSKIVKAITPNTKAIMPVWAYGQAPEMDKIMGLAQTYGLSVIEDACPAVGSFYKNKHAGSFGDFGCFSFHGAKIMTTGFGGMLVTNSKALFDKMEWLADHGEDKGLSYRFWQTGVGYSFDLPNINCAMGLAQLERIEVFVKKKRQIYQWYRNNLGGVPGIVLNENTSIADNARVNMWLTSVVLEKDFRITRDGVIRRLKAKGIDTRPFFFPISQFPMYQEEDTPTAHKICLNGINLPSGIQRTEREIDFICDTLKEILCV